MSARRAFTLIELLVTIAIILVLAGLLLPVVSRARAESRRAVCRSQLGQLAKAVQMYASEHGSRYPALAGRPTLEPQRARLCDALMPYAKDARVFRCPADDQGFHAKEGSSYEWNTLLNGKGQDGLVEQFLGPTRTPLLYDYENFHPDPGAGSYGGKNVVFCDGSVQ